jgi:hypothetical protein
MKTNFTTVCKVLLTTLIISGFSSVKAQQTCTAPSMTWNNPTLVSGTDLQVNAVYKFPNITPGVYALVTVTTIVNGATLISIDDNVNNGYPAAWQPVVQTPSAQVASDSYVSFKIEFKNNADNSNHQYNCFQLSFIDIDGDFDHIREFVATKNFDTYTVSNNTQLTVTQISGGITQATGPLQGYSAIDTSAYATNINFRFTNKAVINEVRLGNRVDAEHEIDGRFNCGYFAPVTMPLLLPVSYLSFDALVNGETVLVKWATGYELNNSHFEVERSFDMNSFNTAGLVLDGFTINGSGKSYQFKDNSAQLKGRSMVYYRLKQVDIDGKATYSKVLAVRLQAKSDVAMQVSPNPFVEDVTISFTSTENGNAQIRITNLAGQTMLSKQSTIAKGYNNIKIDNLSGLAAGMYLAQLTLNGTVISNQKLIKN